MARAIAQTIVTFRTAQSDFLHLRQVRLLRRHCVLCVRVARGEGDGGGEVLGGGVVEKQFARCAWNGDGARGVFGRGLIIGVDGGNPR